MEVWNGELRLLVATDINDGDKAVISLEGAREHLRRERPAEQYLPTTAGCDHHEHPWRTSVIQVVGTGAAAAVALQLITHSLWFRSTPLPDGEFEFAVKVEHADMLHHWARNHTVA